MLREAFKEIGLRDLRIERYPRAGEYDMRPYVDAVHVRHYFLLSVDSADVPDRWYAYERGDGDEPTRFEVWLPLEHAQDPLPGQAALLGRIFD